MLSRADLELTRRDTGISGLGTLLDVAAIEGRIRRLAPDFPLEAPLSAASYIRYVPGRRCVAAYASARSRGFPAVYASAGPAAADGEPAPPDRAAPGTDLLNLDDLCVEIRAFPNDRRLRTLRRMADPAARGRLLSAVGLDRQALGCFEPELLRYRPERRCVLRLGPASGPAVVMKLHWKHAFEAAQHNSERFQPGKVLQVPRRLGTSDRHRAMAFAWIPGCTVRSMLRGARPDFEAIGRAGVALAELQSQDPGGNAPELDPLADLDRTRAFLSAVAPEHDGRTTDLVSRIAEALGAIEPVHRSVHGDFHDDQVIVAGDRIAILDLDEACLGNPLVDPGRFLAHLERDRILGQIPPGVARRARRAFLDGYQRILLPTDALSIFVALGLVRLLPSVFRKSRDHWPDLIASLLDAVEDTLRLPG